MEREGRKEKKQVIEDGNQINQLVIGQWSIQPL